MGARHFLVLTLPAFQVSLTPPMIQASLQHPPGSSPQDYLLPPLPAPRVCLHCIITCTLGRWTPSCFCQSLLQQQCSAWLCFQTHRGHAGRPVWHLSLRGKGGSIVIDFLLGHISSFKKHSTLIHSLYFWVGLLRKRRICTVNENVSDKLVMGLKVRNLTQTE